MHTTAKMMISVLTLILCVPEPSAHTMGYMVHTMMVYKLIAVNIRPTLALRAMAARRDDRIKVKMTYKYITPEIV